MTYCVGLLVNQGIVLLADTRTNAGVDNIATYRKMFIFETPGDRVVAIMAAGSLSITQTTIARLAEANVVEGANPETAILLAPTMMDVAAIIGNTLAKVRSEVEQKLAPVGQGAAASMIVAGQRRGGRMRMFLVYPEGNFIQATDDTPFLQIGEHKYGKPILDRVVRPETSLADAQKAALLSMDSTLRSNLSVGMPLDLAVIDRDACRMGLTRRYEAGDPEFRGISEAWANAIRESFANILV